MVATVLVPAVAMDRAFPPIEDTMKGEGQI